MLGSLNPECLAAAALPLSEKQSIVDPLQALMSPDRNECTGIFIITSLKKKKKKISVNNFYLVLASCKSMYHRA